MRNRVQLKSAEIGFNNLLQCSEVPGDFCKEPEKTHKSSAEIPVDSTNFIDFAIGFYC